MENYILIGIGIFNIIITSRVIFSKGFAEKYVTKSPKAYLWRKFFGEEKAIKIIKNFLAPIGLLLGIVLVIVGIAL